MSIANTYETKPETTCTLFDANWRLPFLSKNRYLFFIMLLQRHRKIKISKILVKMTFLNMCFCLGFNMIV